MKTVYLSKSNNCVVEDITAAVEAIEKAGNEVLQYITGQPYDEKLIGTADALVAVPYPQFHEVAIQGHADNMDIDVEIVKGPEVPNVILAGMGQFKEVQKSITLSKPTFIFIQGNFYLINILIEFAKEDRNAKTSWGSITIQKEACVPEFMLEEDAITKAARKKLDQDMRRIEGGMSEDEAMNRD